MSSFWLKAKQWLAHGGSFRLRPYESACIAAWRQTLSESALVLLDEQCKRLGVYQRYSGERQLCFYDMTDKSCESWPREILFPCQSEEVAVARLKLRSVAAPEVVLKADVILVRGRFFGLDFSKSPQSLREGVEVLNVKTLVDLMHPGGAAAPVSLVEVPGELQAWLRRMAATDLRKPLPPAKREQLMQAIDAPLPPDYVELAAATDGATIAGWRIYGPSEIRRTAMPDGNYYLLAETQEGRTIGVAQEGAAPDLYLFATPEADLPEAAGQSLLVCIERDVAAHTG